MIKIAYSPLYTSATKVYSKTGLSATEVNLSDDDILKAVVEDAEVELESVTGRKFTDANSITEYFSIKRADIIGNKQTSIVLSQHPILGITVLNIVDSEGNAISTYDTLTTTEISAGTYESDDYWVLISIDPLTQVQSPDGRIKLKTGTFPEGTNNVKVTYTYGYSSVPVIVADLATCLAGIRMWIRFIGGEYNRLNSYSIPQQTANKGDFYQRGLQNIQMLTEEAERLYKRIGKRKITFFASSGGDR